MAALDQVLSLSRPVLKVRPGAAHLVGHLFQIEFDGKHIAAICTHHLEGHLLRYGSRSGSNFSD